LGRIADLDAIGLQAGMLDQFNQADGMLQLDQRLTSIHRSTLN
jgi:hypothetical protein